MDRASTRNILEIKKCKEMLHELQNEFFTEIKRIADSVSIEMPEPSEIDLLSDKLVDPKAVIEAYCSDSGLADIKHKNLQLSFAELLAEILQDVRTSFYDITSSKETEETASLIMQSLESVQTTFFDHVSSAKTNQTAGSMMSILKGE